MQATTHLVHTHTSADILLQCNAMSCRPSLKCKYAVRRAAETAVWMLCTPDSHLAASARACTLMHVFIIFQDVFGDIVCVCGRKWPSDIHRPRR